MQIDLFDNGIFKMQVSLSYELPHKFFLLCWFCALIYNHFSIT
jgi:hypothetical protein